MIFFSSKTRTATGIACVIAYAGLSLGLPVVMGQDEAVPILIITPDIGLPMLVGDSYCSYSPDLGCYIDGHPECCGNDAIECPDEPPECEVDFSILGASYCTHSPNTNCYEGGWPKCCGNDAIKCPKTPPPCETGCKTLAEIVCEAPDLSELCKLVVRAGLADALSGGTWTVFAPRNGGFDDLDNIKKFSKDRLKRLLLFHVVPNEELYASDLKCHAPDNLITMANGFDSRTRCKKGVPTFQKGRDNSDNSPPIIVKDDIEACNGVAHVLSEVLLYKEYD